MKEQGVFNVPVLYSHLILLETMLLWAPCFKDEIMDQRVCFWILNQTNCLRFITNIYLSTKTNAEGRYYFTPQKKKTLLIRKTIVMIASPWNVPKRWPRRSRGERWEEEWRWLSRRHLAATISSLQILRILTCKTYNHNTTRSNHSSTADSHLVFRPCPRTAPPSSMVVPRLFFYTKTSCLKRPCCMSLEACNIHSATTTNIKTTSVINLLV